jgi:hypothetical protein
MSSLRRLLWRALPGLAFWAVAGCQVLLDGEVTSIHCTQEGAIGPGACPASHICTGGACVEFIPSEPQPQLGVLCEDDADCEPGDFCLDMGRIRLQRGKRCSRPCCSSSGCDPAAGFICWAPSTGGASFCVDAVLVGRAIGGVAASGERCSTDGDCRSGSCDSGGTCVDPCCSDTSCAASQGTCQFGKRDGTGGFFCAPPPSDTRPFLADCKLDTDCASGLCHELRCVTPCCNSDTCSVDTTDGSLIPVACQFIEHEGVLIRACAHTLKASMIYAVGQPCSVDSECRGGLCIRPDEGEGEGYCSDACCSDAFCGEGGGFHCRPPEEITSSWPLRCELK